jgi:hypothetical protein
MKNYVIVAHGKVIDDKIQINFLPINNLSKLYFYVNEGCILSVFNNDGKNYLNSEVKESICNHTIGYKNVINYDETYSNMRFSPTDKNTQVFIQDCESQDNIINFDNMTLSLYDIISRIESYHHTRYDVPYILHIFSCRAYIHAGPSPRVCRSISGQHNEEIHYRFTKNKLIRYYDAIKQITSDDLREEYENEINSIITGRELYMMEKNRKITIDLEKYDRLIILGKKLGLKINDIDLFDVEKNLESKRYTPPSSLQSPEPPYIYFPNPSSVDTSPSLFHQPNNWKSKYMKYKIKYLNSLGNEIQNKKNEIQNKRNEIT